MPESEMSKDYIMEILADHDPAYGWSFAPCPFCGSRDIGVKYQVLDRKMGHDCPCSAEKKLWAYCRYCEAAGSKMVGDIVDSDEMVALALEGWNKRSSDGEIKKRNRKTDRNKEIYALRKEGSHYRQIAERYGISITRVRQIIEAEEAADDSICKDNSRQI